ncbi:hypothetical protein Poli38472_006110 [Pythium oligandrum]|uniref:BD-FAE-like domain-containing protein n=1 Tax=Pythium oligandrum TaxID=41045 RepID=A0A8K1FR56_PYTOL|nr:hypothetical protein Poli38472_006110 [Pythium oligandrum]|eukprot:TMW68642.1 hypothetical protein Poli38472_006110 [Pythium oligandrum]
MKILPSARLWGQQHGVSAAYLAFAVLMLQLARRGGTKEVVRDNLVSFFAAVVPTELAHKLLAMNALVIYKLREAHTPLLSSWVGSLAVFCHGLAILKFLQNNRENVSAKQFIRAAMEQQSDIAHEKLRAIGNLSLQEWIGVVLPLPQPMALSLAYAGVRKIKTVTFAHVGENRTSKLRMDVYKHDKTPPNAPILVYVHGGAWMFGTRERAPLPLLYQVANHGWVVCSVDYRLSPKVAFPDHLIDVKRAIAYLRQNARNEFDADPEFIAVAGESAGGHLASLVALTATDKSLQPGFEDVDTSVRACIDNYGVHDFLDRHGLYFYKDKGHGFLKMMEVVIMQRPIKESLEQYEQASPVSWLMDDKHCEAKQGQLVPPFLLSHGTHDTLVPFDDSSIFYEKLQKHRARTGQRIADIEDVFIEIPGAHHAFNYLMSPRALAYGDAVCAFLENVHSKTKDLPLGCVGGTGVASSEDKAILSAGRRLARL